MATPEPGTLVQLAVLLLTLEPHRDAFPSLLELTAQTGAGISGGSAEPCAGGSLGSLKI